jgi:hypothetical protein
MTRIPSAMPAGILATTQSVAIGSALFPNPCSNRMAHPSLTPDHRDNPAFDFALPSKDINA